MSAEFEWEPEKAATNLQKHGVSFIEAATVFFDPLSITIPDPLHSLTENRFVITGHPTSTVNWWWSIWIAMIEYESSVRVWPRQLKGKNMNQELNNQRDPDVLDEYDFSGGVRGKYTDRFAKGCNVVVLDPDVAQVFTDSESVNQALRALVGIIQHQSEKPHP